MIKLKRDKWYNPGDDDCTYKVVDGDLTKHIIRIGYSTTFYDTEPITKSDIKDLYIYVCYNDDDNKTMIFISIREDWDLIFVGRKTGNYVENKVVIESAINAWIHNN